MDKYQTKKKKKLDFTRPTFEQRDFDFPAPDIPRATKTVRSIAESSKRSSFADDEESSRDSDSSSPMTVFEEKVQVFLRLKPTVERTTELYRFDEQCSNVYLKGNSTTVERQYTFSQILNEDADQRTVYENCVRPLLDSPFSTSGAVVASYGVSNSGKTYTILGEKSAGVVPRALTQIYSEYGTHVAPFPYLKVCNEQVTILNDAQVNAEIDMVWDFLNESRQNSKGKVHDSWINAIKDDHQFEAKEFASDRQRVHIWVSFVEIYNEKMIDLFRLTKPAATAHPNSLKIISNNGNSYVLGLTWLHVSKLEIAIELLQHGLRRVNYASTGLNAHSSRSHTIFTINMISECDASYEFCSFKFCDLAGAERISKTGNQGQRVKETGGINTSLHVLGRCLEAVQHNQKQDVKKKDVVPVRESKLSFLLQASLLGHEKFVMIVNLLPTAECFEENINVLHFGSIANKIVTRKTNAKKFSRCSSRYTFFMQHAVNSPKMNSSILEESMFLKLEESSLGFSFERNNMTADELRHALHKKELECECLRQAIEQKEREFLEKIKSNRQENLVTQASIRNSDRQYYEEKEKLLKDFHEKKINSLRQTHERKKNDFIQEIEMLEMENQKLKLKFGIKDDEDVIDLEDDDDYESTDGDDSNEGAN